MPAVDVLANVKCGKSGDSEGSIEVVVSDLAVSAISSEVAPTPEAESGAGRSVASK